jgi:hypothetical protein
LKINILRKFFMAESISITRDLNTGKCQVSFSNDLPLEARYKFLTTFNADPSLQNLMRYINQPVKFIGEVENLSLEKISLVADAAASVFSTTSALVEVDLDEAEADAYLEADFKDLTNNEKMAEIGKQARDRAAAKAEEAARPFQEAQKQFSAVCQKTGLELRVIERVVG